MGDTQRLMIQRIIQRWLARAGGPDVDGLVWCVLDYLADTIGSKQAKHVARSGLRKSMQLEHIEAVEVGGIRRHVGWYFDNFNRIVGAFGCAVDTCGARLRSQHSTHHSLPVTCKRER